MRPRRIQEASQISLVGSLVGSWPPRGPKTPPRRAKTFPRTPFGGVLGLLGPSWVEKVANMAPSWAPKTEPKSVLGRPGGVLGAFWRRLEADLM